MELFLPSVLVLLIAAAVVFFVLPQFGPATLAIISAVLLALGLYQHYTMFGTEYRYSTWQLVSFSPYLLIGGLFVVIAIFLLYTMPVSGPVAPNVELPSIANMPSANTSTNGLTELINNSLNTAANLLNGTPTTTSNGNGIFSNLANTVNRNLFGKNANRGYKGLNIPFSQI